METPEGTPAPPHMEAASATATRSYLTSFIRWWPLMVCVAALLLVVALVPPPKSGHALAVHSSPSTGETDGTGSTGAASATGAGGATPTASTAAPTIGAEPGAPGAPGDSPSRAPAAVPDASGAVNSSARVGVARTGVSCTPGALQFSWSPYAPTCVPAFTGNNGGATSQGVTGSTINLSYRVPNSNEEATVASLAGSAFPNDPAFIADLQTYIRYFNSQFELYGRKVVLTPFQAQGDYLEEEQGQDLAGAQADAATAQSLGAFADATFPLFSSQFYAQDLAEEHVVSFGGLAYTTQWYEQYAPYEFSESPTGTAGANGFVQLACDRLAGLPAIFAGETSYQAETRVFGLIAPDNPQYQATTDLIQDELQSTCGQSIAKRVSYAIDVSSFEQQATSVIAQMKAAGVTTIICLCDPLFPILLDQTADQQQYYPEWVGVGFLDPAGRLPAQDQMAHSISQEGAAVPSSQSEAYRVFQLADPGGTPAEQYYQVAFYEMLYIFDGLQAAGPDLTPVNLAKGFFSMPTSAQGELGVWQGGQGAFSPITETQIGWWNPNAISNFDGQKGAWESCDSGQWYRFSDPTTWAPDHTQLSCFGH
jgi:hypothetical protein